MTALPPERLAEIEVLGDERQAIVQGQARHQPYEYRRAIRDLLAELRREPDHAYEPEYWDVTYAWNDRGELVDNMDLDIGDVREICCLRTLPAKWIANVVLTRDERGDVDETEVRWFDTREEAEAAAKGEG